MMGYIGKLKHPNWTAVLLDDGTWQSDRHAIAELLNDGYSPRRLYSPSQGAYGFRQLHEAADVLGAKVVDVAPPKDRSGKIY